MSILDQAVPVDDTVTSVNILVYGDSGAGKTYFAGSGVDGGKNNLIIATDNGTVSAAKAGSKTSTLLVKDWETLDQVVTAIEDEPTRFDWVILDSVTHVQDLIWQDLDTDRVKQNPHKSPYKRELQEYGEAQARLREVVSRLVNCDANVIFTALAQLHTDEEANEFQVPSIHGQKGDLAMWVASKMDVVAYLSVRRKDNKIYRRFDFQKGPEFLAKDRLGLYEKPKANLTLAELTEKLVEESEEKDN